MTKPIVMRNGAPAQGEEHMYNQVATYRGYAIYERIDDGESNSTTDPEGRSYSEGAEIEGLPRFSVG